MTAHPGSGWKAAPCSLARLAAACARFGGDQRGTVAIQMLIFSVLLFGTTGLVLDAGRVYATHTQMQAFADHVALAAANELDGRPDAIERAAAAAFGGEDGPFLAKAGLEVGLFDVERVDFYPDPEPSPLPQNDMRGAFPAGARLASAMEAGLDVPGGDPVAAAEAATVAVVSVAEKRMRSAIARLSAAVIDIATATSPGGADGSPFPSDLGIAAVAAAALERRSCAPLSTLVFCNPWEGLAQSPLETPKEDSAWSVPGRSLVTFAPSFKARGLPELPQTAPNAASAVPWSLRNQLFRLTSPVADSAGLCSPGNLPALDEEDAGTEGAPDYLAARDRCLMARAHRETVCWGPGAPLTVAPADGDTVVRALNTAFDNWMEPFDQALAADVSVAATSLTLSQFFEPDAVATTAFESGDWHGPDPEAEPRQDGIADYPDPAGRPVGPYETVPLPEFAPFEEFEPEPGRGLGIGYDPCHDGTLARYAGDPGGAACALDFVGDYYEGGSDGAAEVRERLEYYWSTMYGRDPASLPGNVTSWYELYDLEKTSFEDLDTSASLSRIVEYSPDNAARLGLPATTDDYVKLGPDEYLTATGRSELLNPGRERRLLRSLMVNCAATVANGADGAGGYRVDPGDVRIMDVYLPQPPGIFCGANEVGCELEEAVEARLFVELVDDLTEDSEHRRYVARLVR